MDPLVPHAGDEATQEGATDVAWNVGYSSFLRIRELLLVSHFLEERLEKSDSWVDASSGNATGHANSGVEG